MGVGGVLAVVLAGGAAGTINTVVGTGSLISFPTLLALGVPPVVANASNTTGLVPGGLSGTFGYRQELSAQRARLVPLVVASLVGGAAGARLLFALPRSAFDTVVPALVLLGSLLVAVQPALSRRLRARAATDPGERDGGAPAPARVSGPLIGVVGLLGVYGGYFGAGQGVILIALLGLGERDDLQTVNALKNAAVTAANCAAAVVFVGVATLDWTIVGLIAVGSVLGGQIGARLARRLPAGVLRALVVIVGLVVSVRLAMR
jgi:uncharacterized membrane protein YfcA